MKRATRKKQASIQRMASTGRDGAIDFVAKSEMTNAKVPVEDRVYRVIEVVGTSSKSIEDAINQGVGRASRTLRNLRWFEVVKTSGYLEGGKVRYFQATLKVGFTMEERR